MSCSSKQWLVMGVLQRSPKQLAGRRRTYQQPVRDRGGRRMRGGAIMLLSDLPSRTSSFGAMTGRRSERLAEAWPRRFCITKLVTVIRLTGCL